MVCQKPVSVDAANSGITINSQGVLELKDSIGKKIVLDSGDFVRLRDAVDNLGAPELKVTYHEHTDDCYTSFGYCTGIGTGVPGIYQFINEDGFTLTSWPTANSSTPNSRLRCIICGRDVTAYRRKSTSSDCGQKDYSIGGSFALYAAEGASSTIQHKDSCPFHWDKYANHTYYKLTCGKTTDTIESVELIVN